jgi:hypothetical protein
VKTRANPEVDDLIFTNAIVFHTKIEKIPITAGFTDKVTQTVFRSGEVTEGVISATKLLYKGKIQDISKYPEINNQ